MKLPCAVIRDLLPLFSEGLVEPDTKELVDRHLADCPDCQKRFSELKVPAEPPVETVKPLQALKKELHRRRRLAVLLAALCVLIGVFTYFFRTQSMKYVPWQEDLIRVEGVRTVEIKRISLEEELWTEEPALRAAEDANADSAKALSGAEPLPETGASPAPTIAPPSYAQPAEGLVLRISSRIRGFDEHEIEEEDGTTTCYLQAVSTEGRFSGPVLSYTEFILNPVPDRLIYGYEQPQVLLWGTAPNGGAEVLPRLTLTYYLLIAAILTGALGLLWLLFRKRQWSWIPRQAFFAPASYILSQLLLKGFTCTSFFITQDLLSILFILLAFYALLSVAWQMVLYRRRG